jgi:serine/threonine protein kinase
MADLSTPKARLVRFGPFELDVRAGELRKHGIRIKLREQPIQILLLLLAHPGEVVLREEIRLRLWPNNTIVEFDHGINAAIQKLRDALGESADQPRYVETVARRGYRFLGEVEKIGEPNAAPSAQVEPAKATAVECAVETGDLTGQTISHYRILNKLGAGGMGVVYRAEDHRLGRQVALKFLPDELVHQPAALARFEREARAVSALNHPNICTLHDVGSNYLVMEFIEGPTLAERIAASAVPITEALAIAREIAAALEAAHEKGIIHCDLKPANVKLTSEGKAKVLDFGLAKALEGDSQNARPTGSPTVTPTETRPGAIVGTAGYMSPEQGRGLTVDKRTDIWSYGVVLYEILSGRQLFQRDTFSVTLTAVLSANLDWSALPAATPAPIRRLLRRCLERDRNKRLRAIGDALLEIDEALATRAEDVMESAATPVRKTSWYPRSIAAVVALALILVLPASWRSIRPVRKPLMRLSVDLGPETIGVREFFDQILSPDGSRIVYSIRSADGKQRLATRSLDQAQPTPLPGSEGDSGVFPFFSPDGQWVAFFADGKLKKTLVSGGGAITLCDAPEPRGGSWGDDGNIVLAPDYLSGLSRISSSGGILQPVTELNKERKERTHRWPQVLPGSKAVLFVANTALANYEEATIEVQSLKTGQRKTLQRGYAPRYLPSGHLLYMHGGIAYAAPMDPKRLALNGPAVPVLEDVAGRWSSGGPNFDFSSTGALTYTARPPAPPRPILWLERSGKTQPLLAAPGIYSSPRFAPDGKRLAVSVSRDGKSDVWIYDWERDTMRRVTSVPGSNSDPVWTPDGKRIAFYARGAGGLYWTSADGVGEAQRLTESKNQQVPGSFSPDGKWLAFAEWSPETSWGIWMLPIDLNSGPAGKPRPFPPTPLLDSDPAFSPDGRWLANVHDSGGQVEVVVRPFPGPGGSWQVSNGGGDQPVWSRNGRELFYRAFDRRIMTVGYRMQGGSFVADKPQVWCEKPLPFYYEPSRNFDLAPDGTRLAFPMSPEGKVEQEGSTHVILLLNFFDELKRQAPVGGK